MNTLGDIIIAFYENDPIEHPSLDWSYERSLIFEIYTSIQKFRVYDGNDEKYIADGNFGEVKVECDYTPKTGSYTHNKYKGKTEESHIFEEMFDIKPRSHTTTYHYERETINYVEKWINQVNLVVGDVRLDKVKSWTSSSRPKFDVQDHDLSKLSYWIKPRK